MRLDTHELAWAAGFFDGEGNTGVNLDKRRGSGTPYAYPRIIVAQAGDTRVLERFQAALAGLGKIYGPIDVNRYYERKNRQPQYRWNIYGFEKTQAIISMLWKWLDTVKREQARGVLLRTSGRFEEAAAQGEPTYLGGAA